MLGATYSTATQTCPVSQTFLLCHLQPSSLLASDSLGGKPGLTCSSFLTGVPGLLCPGTPVYLSLRFPFLSSLVGLLPLHSFQKPWAPVPIAFVLLSCSVSSWLRLASVYILGDTFISQAQHLSWNQSPIFGFAQMLYLALKVLLILTPSYLRTIPPTIPAKVQNSVTLH